MGWKSAVFLQNLTRLLGCWSWFSWLPLFSFLHSSWPAQVGVRVYFLSPLWEILQEEAFVTSLESTWKDLRLPSPQVCTQQSSQLGSAHTATHKQISTSSQKVEIHLKCFCQSIEVTARKGRKAPSFPCQSFSIVWKVNWGRRWWILSSRWDYTRLETLTNKFLTQHPKMLPLAEHLCFNIASAQHARGKDLSLLPNPHKSKPLAYMGLN